MPRSSGDDGGPASGAIEVAVQRLAHGRDLPLPRRQSAAAAGMDLYAAVPADAPVELRPGARAMIATGLAMALPDGFEAQVRPRSGLAARHGVTVLNSPGTVDADYRGEIKVILINHGDESFTVERGARIAQLVVQAVVATRLVETETLDETERGAGGFGSSGGLRAGATTQQ